MHCSDKEEKSIYLITLILVGGYQTGRPKIRCWWLVSTKLEQSDRYKFGRKTISISFAQPTLFSKLVCNCDQLVSIWPFYNSWYLRWNFKGHSFSWVHSLLITKHRLFYDFRLLSCTYSRFPWTLRIAKVCHGQYAGQQHQGPFLRRCRHKLMGRVNPCHTATAHPRHNIQLNFLKRGCFCQKKGDLRRLMGATRD